MKRFADLLCVKKREAYGIFAVVVLVLIALGNTVCFSLALKEPNMQTQAHVSSVRDRILIKRLNEDRKTAGGIVLPETDKTKIIEGEVFAVGRGNLTAQGVYVPVEVKRGDRIMFHVGSANELAIDGESFYCLKEQDILAVIRRQPVENQS